MYFPYVFGRRSELLAIRAIIPKYSASGDIIPVIEPVLKKTNDLVKCIKALGDNGVRGIVIVNPLQGEFKTAIPKEWIKEIDEVIADYPELIVGIKCTSQLSLISIKALIKKYSTNKVALIYCNSQLNDEGIDDLIKDESIAFHICLDSKMPVVQRKKLPHKKAIDIEDKFNKQVRNADYSGSEHYTDKHKLFSSSGVGFGDFTITGNTFQPGGGPPGAVAIHACYKHPKSGDIWIEHFVSDETDIDVGSSGSKYLEAVEKIVSISKTRKTEFGSNEALDAYASDYLTGHFPGLGKSKERQIVHHIILMHQLCGL
jgi:hypothetical protein